MWAFRCGFFRDCRDISRWDVQCELAEALGVDINAVEKRIHEGTAFARLATDYQDADKMRIEGSPSFVLNEGRQKLYGDVGFRIIEANRWRPSQLVLVSPSNFGPRQLYSPSNLRKSEEITLAEITQLLFRSGT